MEKKSVEWDLNEWRWDGDLFMAAPLNSEPSTELLPVLNGLSSGSDERKTDLEKRRYVEVNEEGGSLNLKLGVVETEKEGDKCGKKAKISASSSLCQVEDCKADLSNAKDYHRRHKVCDVHSKATSAVVGNVMQRFCQQCSRFHVLQEFDEGKRSCRRRLAGHNKRRRKTHPENVVSATNVNDEQGINYLLINLLRVLSNSHSSSSDQTNDQDMLSHLLRNLASLVGSCSPSDGNHQGLPFVSQDLQNAGTSSQTAAEESIRVAEAAVTIPSSDLAETTRVIDNAVTHIASASPFLSQPSNSIEENTLDTGFRRVKMSNIDLNNAYDCSQDSMDDLQDNVAPQNVGNASNAVPLCLCKDSQQFRPPQNSGDSGSIQNPSPSTSITEEQSRTDRIVFKLFGKDPSGFPLVLRKQILDWLSSSPTDIESYIRPGCLVLTIYACMDQSSWEELYCNLNASLRILVKSSTDSFWRTGWIYARLRHRAAFVYNGEVVLDTPLPLKSHERCRISSISPVAVSHSEDVRFVVKGFNLSLSTSRLLCALEGEYLIRENCADMMERANSFIRQHEDIQFLSFSCAIPNIAGRGFIEVEDLDLESSFFPFIVAEEDVCSEICNLESIIEAENGDTTEVEARNQALDFVHEMGWLLHKTRLIFRLGRSSGDVDQFPFKRFRWLIEFAIDQDWCAVVKKLLSTLFDGIVDAGQHSSSLDALMDIGLLHRAVWRNSRLMVKFLLEYHPTGAEFQQLDEDQYLFRPDMVGPAGLTPLHVAASLECAEGVLDALTEDPKSVGIEAWTNAQDNTGLTPEEYACKRGHYSYMDLVERKMKKRSRDEQIVVEVGGGIVLETSSGDEGGLQIEKRKRSQSQSQSQIMCKECEQKVGYGRRSSRASVKLYKPARFSMVAIAALCVCAALLFKSAPQVVYCFRPFRWELLKYGPD